MPSKRRKSGDELICMILLLEIFTMRESCF